MRLAGESDRWCGGARAITDNRLGLRVAPVEAGTGRAGGGGSRHSADRRRPRGLQRPVVARDRARDGVGGQASAGDGQRWSGGWRRCSVMFAQKRKHNRAAGVGEGKRDAGYEFFKFVGPLVHSLVNR
jgi:hypothetical protein